MEKRNKSRGLGRGLSALMADVSTEMSDSGRDASRRADMRVPVESLHPNPNQPRRSFGEDALKELASSLTEKGVIQPLIVRPDPRHPGGYEIVAGERRWRAAQMAQLHELPVIIRDYTDTEVLEVAIIENIQRADLNSIDEASGYKQLMERFGHTQEQLATALGKSRSHIANQLRLLTLPDEVQTNLVDGQLTAGHARTLIGHESALELARRIIKDKLSVREAEKLASRKPASPGVTRDTTRRTVGEKDPDTVQIERELSATLGMGVSIEHTPGAEGGQIVLRYRSLEQLDDLLRVLAGN